MQSLIPGHNNSLTIIGLLRHGRTVWNEEGRIQGRHDSPLSKSGRLEVLQWARFLSTLQIDHIIASDLGRVRETVALLQQCRKETAAVKWEPGLREQNWGRWEGLTFAELKENQGQILEKQIRAGWDFCPPEGESRRNLLNRVLPLVQDIAARYRNRRILLVCHEGVIKSLIYHLAGRAFLPEEKKLLQKRQLHLLTAENDQLSLGPLNVLPAAGGKNR